MSLADLLGRIGSAASDYAKFVADNLGKLGRWVASGFTSELNNGNNATYTPPFLGGQCNKPYSVSFYQRFSDGTTLYYYTRSGFPSASPPSLSESQNAFLSTGAISSISWSGAGLSGFGTIDIFINGSAYYANNNQASRTPTGFGVFGVVTQDGSPDNCGNLPPPNSGSPQDNPYPTGGAPSDTNGDLVNGSSLGGGSPPVPPPVPSPYTPAPTEPSEPSPVDPSLAGIANGVGGVLELLSKFIGLVNSILDLLNRLNKLFSKKEQRIFGLGSIEGDGYLSFSPMVDNGWNPLSLEVFVYEKPIYLSKWFGYKSPHYYNSGLGSISFVDGSFCIRNGRKEVNYVRSSYDCPQSVGIYYHFGLDKKIKAQISLLMEKG